MDCGKEGGEIRGESFFSRNHFDPFDPTQVEAIFSLLFGIFQNVEIPDSKNLVGKYRTGRSFDTFAVLVRVAKSEERTRNDREDEVELTRR